MWKCKNCNEKLQDTFDACWNCGTTKDGIPPENPDDFRDETLEEMEPDGKNQAATQIQNSEFTEEQVSNTKIQQSKHIDWVQDNIVPDNLRDETAEKMEFDGKSQITTQIQKPEPAEEQSSIAEHKKGQKSQHRIKKITKKSKLQQFEPIDLVQGNIPPDVCWREHMRLFINFVIQWHHRIIIFFYKIEKIIEIELNIKSKNKKSLDLQYAKGILSLEEYQKNLWQSQEIIHQENRERKQILVTFAVAIFMTACAYLFAMAFFSSHILAILISIIAFVWSYISFAKNLSEKIL